MKLELFVVTVKLPKNPEHNPHDKRTNQCPLQPMSLCTDATDEHHSFLSIGSSAEDVRTKYERFYHVTRVETAIWDIG